MLYEEYAVHHAGHGPGHEPGLGGKQVGGQSRTGQAKKKPSAEEHKPSLPETSYTELFFDLIYVVVNIQVGIVSSVFIFSLLISSLRTSP